MDAPSFRTIARQQPARPHDEAGPGHRDQALTRSDSRVALLAAEALSLVVRSCSTAPALQLLRRIARADPRLLEAAAVRCRQVDGVDARVRQSAARLLRQTAAGLQDAQQR